MTYRDYRRIGHGPVTSFTLSVHPVLWYGTCAVIGIVGGFLL